MNSHRNETASRISFIHGLVAMPTYRSYWLQDWLYKNEFFPSVMARDRFTSIMWFANIKEELVSKDDCLRKIRFPINHRNTIVPEMFMPHKELLINESIMFWHRRLVFHQYFKNKRNKSGLKFFELCTIDGLNLFRSKISQDP